MFNRNIYECTICNTKGLYSGDLSRHGVGLCDKPPYRVLLTHDTLECELRRFIGALAKVEFKPSPPLAWLTVIEVSLLETQSLAIPNEALYATIDEVSITWLEPFARAVLGLPKKSEKLTYPIDAEIEAFARAIGYAPTDSFKELVRRVVKRWSVPAA